MGPTLSGGTFSATGVGKFVGALLPPPQAKYSGRPCIEHKPEKDLSIPVSKLLDKIGKIFQKYTSFLTGLELRSLNKN